MGKHEVGTPKYIANKIKSKGLQKLRWYCQVCQKQCRDENGFKCHTMSEAHHRQILLFADNAGKYMDQYSKEFSLGFLSLLKRQFGTKRVPANRVYQDYITDRHHIHMNATQWLSLTGFVKHLGRTGKCIVDETEKGWFITYIDRDPETLAALEKKEKKQKMDKDDEERTMHFIQKQVKKGSETSQTSTEEFKQPLERLDDAPLVLELKLKPKKVLPLISPISSKLTGKSKDVEVKQEIDVYEDVSDSDKPSTSKRKESLVFEDKSSSSKRRKNDDHDIPKGWLKVSLSVKVVTKSLGEKYYKAKGVVKEIIDSGHYVGKVKLKSPDEVKGCLIKIDQEHLETVIPSIGREVMILYGPYENEIALVEKVRIDDFCIDVELIDSKKLLKKLPYEQVCKYIDEDL